MPSKYFAIQGVATFLRHTGATTLPQEPPNLERGEIVLCIHHHGGNSRNFDSFSSELADDHSPVAFDLPGHDRSGSQVSLGSIETMADFAAQVLKALQVDRPAVVVGHGMGGNVALQMALEHGEAVKALVLVNSAARYVGGDELVERQRLVSLGRARREFEIKAFAPETPQSVVRAGYMDMLKTDPRVIYPNLMAMRDWNGGERLAEVAVPTLICVGDTEQGETATEVDRMAGAVSNARKEVIPDAAQMLPLEHPGALAQCVKDFLGGLS
ncbi:MAG: alpha/beta fold hydrolase [bacterium]|nr:alpha/beta fold hydrolase [bacterium]